MLLVRLKSSLGVLAARLYAEGRSISTFDAHRFSDETIFDLSYYKEFTFGQTILEDNNNTHPKPLYCIVCKDFDSDHCDNKAISFLFKEEAMGEYQKLKRILEDRLAK